MPSQVPSFRVLSSRLWKFHQAQDESWQRQHVHLVCEAMERLNQLEYLVAEVQRRITELEHVNQVISERLEGLPELPEAKRAGHLCFEITLMTEAFYYFAGRLRTILAFVQIMPSRRGGRDFVGVRNVRNMLIEHPEKSGTPVLARTFRLDGPDGPTVKELRFADLEGGFRDSGLYANATELRTVLADLLAGRMPRSAGYRSRRSKRPS